MNQSNKIMLIIVILALVGGGYRYYQTNEAKKNDSVAQLSAAEERNRQKNLESCLSDGASQKFCECFVAEVPRLGGPLDDLRNMSREELQRVSERANRNCKKANEAEFLAQIRLEVKKECGVEQLSDAVCSCYVDEVEKMFTKGMARKMTNEQFSRQVKRSEKEITLKCGGNK